MYALNARKSRLAEGVHTLVASGATLVSGLLDAVLLQHVGLVAPAALAMSAIQLARFRCIAATHRVDDVVMLLYRLRRLRMRLYHLREAAHAMHLIAAIHNDAVKPRIAAQCDERLVKDLVRRRPRKH